MPIKGDLAMRKKYSALAVAGAACLLLTAASAPSVASDDPGISPPTGAAEIPWDEAASVTFDADGGVTFTGDFPTQSTDPTRWDYVPPDAPDAQIGELAARSAAGTESISAFSYSWQGLQIPSRPVSSGMASQALA